MNKSEIAEKAAREILNFLCAIDWSQSTPPWREKRISEFVERAIAESQAPKPELHNNDRDRGEKMFGKITGNGEPGPPPATQLAPIQAFLVFNSGFFQSMFLTCELAAKFADEKFPDSPEIEIKETWLVERSGAAQEVSPPSSLKHEWFLHPSAESQLPGGQETFTRKETAEFAEYFKKYFGDTRELKAALREMILYAKHGTVGEEAWPEDLADAEKLLG